MFCIGDRVKPDPTSYSERRLIDRGTVMATSAVYVLVRWDGEADKEQVCAKRLLPVSDTASDPG